jgi:hypothetical protein
MSHEPGAEDQIDRLGRRIGRGLAILLAPVAVFFLGRDLGWW